MRCSSWFIALGSMCCRCANTCPGRSSRAHGHEPTMSV